jgi:hypothetical protein
LKDVILAKIETIMFTRMTVLTKCYRFILIR